MKQILLILSFLFITLNSSGASCNPDCSSADGKTCLQGSGTSQDNNFRCCQNTNGNNSPTYANCQNVCAVKANSSFAVCVMSAPINTGMIFLLLAGGCITVYMLYRYRAAL